MTQAAKFNKTDGISSLGKFKSKLGDIARPNRFVVDVLKPPKLPSELKWEEVFRFQVKTAKIPEFTLGSNEIKYRGFTYSIPGDMSHEDLEITFINTINWECRDFFEDWVNLYFEDGNGARASISKDTNNLDTTSILVGQMDGAGKVVKNYEYRNAYPKSISSIELSTESASEVETFSVTFAFTHTHRD